MKSSALGRKKRALELIEKQYTAFKTANQDKVKNGKTIRPFDSECKRFEFEIGRLKDKLRM